MHKRRHYLEDLQTQLKTLAGFGGVWIQRNAPSRNLWPAITVYCESETAERLSVHPTPIVDRVANISIVVWVRGVQDDEQIESDFDSYAEAIESLLITPIGALDFYLVATSFQFSEDDPEINALTLIYALQYESVERSPSY